MYPNINGDLSEVHDRQPFLSLITHHVCAYHQKWVIHTIIAYNDYNITCQRNPSHSPVTSPGSPHAVSFTSKFAAMVAAI